MEDDALGAACARGAFTMFATDASTCSCVEGNPCLVADNCKNWAKRFDIAMKVRAEKLKFDKDFVEC